MKAYISYHNSSYYNTHYFTPCHLIFAENIDRAAEMLFMNYYYDNPESNEPIMIKIKEGLREFEIPEKDKIHLKIV